MPNQMTKSDASRIQSTQTKSGNDPGFASRAQSAADRNANANAQGGNSTGSNNSTSSKSGQSGSR